MRHLPGCARRLDAVHRGLGGDAGQHEEDALAGASSTATTAAISEAAGFRVEMLPNREVARGSEIAAVPVFIGVPTEQTVERALRERGWAIFRPGRGSALP